MNRGLILMYHRIGEPPCDPWSLSVGPRHFAEHLQVLHATADCVPLAHAARESTDRRPLVIVTFDDGYADNYLTALPLLKEFGVPATVFLVAGQIGGQRAFWWDELEQIFLQPAALPDHLELQCEGTVHAWELGDDGRPYSDEEWEDARRWKTSQETSRSRQRIYLELWRQLQVMADAPRRRLLDQLANWAGLALNRACDRTLSDDEVVEMAREASIEIGAHSMTHPLLPTLPGAVQRHEMHLSKATLERLVGRPVSSFSYPYGACSSETIAIAQSVGFARACSTNPNPFDERTDRLCLPRVMVEDWTGDEFRHHLEAWLE